MSQSARICYAIAISCALAPSSLLAFELSQPASILPYRDLAPQAAVPALSTPADVAPEADAIDTVPASRPSWLLEEPVPAPKSQSRLHPSVEIKNFHDLGSLDIERDYRPSRSSSPRYGSRPARSFGLLRALGIQAAKPASRR